LLDQGTAVAYSHAGEVVAADAAQVGEIVGGGEAAIHHGDHAAIFQVRLSSLAPNLEYSGRAKGDRKVGQARAGA
jgi:hypothetical protein